MRIARFSSNGQIHLGQLIDDQSARRIDGDLFGKFIVTDQILKVDKLLAPLVPTDILCIGLNYREHAAESGSAVPVNPMLFIKASNTLANPGDGIPIPKLSTQIDYEAELAVVIGKTAKNISADQVFDYIFGYTIANDVSARDLQNRDGQWARAKGMDTFCPLGPVIVTRDEIPDPHTLTIKTFVNAEQMQNSSTSLLMRRIPELVSYLSQTFTLQPGDIILTGTPSGVGAGMKPPRFLEQGMVVRVEIENIGVLENRCEVED